MYVIMHEKYERNFIEDRYDRVYKAPKMVFKERRNAEDYILKKLPNSMMENNPDYWIGSDTNENHVEMVLGKNCLYKDVFTILHVDCGD